MTDDLLTKFKRNDGSAIKEIYRLVFPACSQLIINHHGTMDDARDIFQEALIILHRNVRRKDFTLNCTSKTYIYSIVRNLWMQRQQQYQKKGLELIMDEPEKEFVIIQQDELEFKKEMEQKHTIIAQCMNMLKEDCQKILLGFYYKKQSLTELAEELGYSNNFIKVKKGRCMKTLREKAQQLLNMLAKE